MPKFTPLPEDVEIVHSFDDITPDEHDGADDGDDSKMPATAPGLIKRLLLKGAPS